MKKEHRKKEVSVFQRVAVDIDTYVTLREQKRKQKKSMSKIVCDDVKEKYKKPTVDK